MYLQLLYNVIQQSYLSIAGQMYYVLDMSILVLVTRSFNLHKRDHAKRKTDHIWSPFWFFVSQVNGLDRHA